MKAEITSRNSRRLEKKKAGLRAKPINAEGGHEVAFTSEGKDLKAHIFSRSGTFTVTEPGFAYVMMKRP